MHLSHHGVKAPLTAEDAQKLFDALGDKGPAQFIVIWPDGKQQIVGRN